MCCRVRTSTRNILIDPGIALGFRRKGLLPHPDQIQRGAELREIILKAVSEATDIIFTHFHGDHVPLLNANPFQLSLKRFRERIGQARIWLKPRDRDEIGTMRQRAMDLAATAGVEICTAEQGTEEGDIHFSSPVFHGEKKSGLGKVTMVKITDGKEVFVHASDIQMQGPDAVAQIIGFRPDTVFVSGPPLYRMGNNRPACRAAFENALRLLDNCGQLVIDHHLLRSRQGLSWLEELSGTSGRNVRCAADFMDLPRCLLEAERRESYKNFPVQEGWHKKMFHI